MRESGSRDYLIRIVNRVCWEHKMPRILSRIPAKHTHTQFLVFCFPKFFFFVIFCVSFYILNNKKKIENFVKVESWLSAVDLQCGHHHRHRNISLKRRRCVVVVTPY